MNMFSFVKTVLWIGVSNWAGFQIPGYSGRVPDILDGYCCKSNLLV